MSDDMETNITGKRVETAVFVCGERVPMHVGIVVADDESGACKVDIGSLHGAAPWIVFEAKSHLRVIE